MNAKCNDVAEKSGIFTLACRKLVNDMMKFLQNTREAEILIRKIENSSLLLEKKSTKIMEEFINPSPCSKKFFQVS